MTQPGEEAARSRSLGLALLDASRIYEDFVIPKYEDFVIPGSEGRLRRRRFPPHRRAIIGLVARQRRFLRAAYALADAELVLEAVGPLRSMLEFLICQRWLALDPERNWKLSEAGRGRLLILLLAYTGLRWGEATALRVCDIDLDRRRLDVRRAFSDVGGRVILGTPKSHQSRTVPLPRFLADEMAAATAGKHADQLVFTMPEGGVMRLTNWRRSVFLSARRRAGLSDRFRLHDLRHTAASLMIQAGYPPKMLQEIMGHASITTTLDLYGHLYPGEMDRYADRLNEAVGMWG